LFRSRLPLSTAIWLAIGVAAPGLALAASADQLPDIRHTVVSGDTLEGVAQRYLKDPQQWRAVGTLNGVKDPLRLRVGSVIVIPAHMVGYQEVTITHVKGVARMRSPQSGSDWQSAASGTILTEGDELQVPAGSYVSLRFADGSSVRINENSQLKLSELRKNSRTDEQQSVLDLSQGGLESHVTPVVDQRRKRKFEIKTPMATTSVRGTVFSVSVTDSGKAITAVDKGVVQVQGYTAKRQPAQQALVPAGTGVAVQASGQVGTPVALLEAPSLERNPAVFEDANFLTLQVGEVPGARQYAVLLALDADLSRVILRQSHASPSFRFEAVPDGTYYLSARALDAQDIPGKPAVHHQGQGDSHPAALFQPCPGWLDRFVRWRAALHRGRLGHCGLPHPGLCQPGFLATLAGLRRGGQLPGQRDRPGRGPLFLACGQRAPAGGRQPGPRPVCAATGFQDRQQPGGTGRRCVECGRAQRPQPAAAVLAGRAQPAFQPAAGQRRILCQPAGQHAARPAAVDIGPPDRGRLLYAHPGAGPFGPQEPLLRSAQAHRRALGRHRRGYRPQNR